MQEFSILRQWHPYVAGLGSSILDSSIFSFDGARDYKTLKKKAEKKTSWNTNHPRREASSLEASAWHKGGACLFKNTDQPSNDNLRDVDQVGTPPKRVADRLQEFGLTTAFRWLSNSKTSVTFDVFACPQMYCSCDSLLCMANPLQTLQSQSILSTSILFMLNWLVWVNISYNDNVVIRPDRDMSSCRNAATELGVEEAQVAKSIAFTVKGIHWLAVLGGNCKVDLNKARIRLPMLRNKFIQLKHFEGLCRTASSVVNCRMC